MGWLNFSAKAPFAQPVEMNELVAELLGLIRDELKFQQHPIAHVKAYITLILNARVDVSPEKLLVIVNEQIAKLILEKKICLDKVKLQCFKPGKPYPTYRI